MVITQVSDVAARRAHVDEMGIRIAFEMNFPEEGHVGMQLHPADTSGGAFFEMDQMTGAHRRRRRRRLDTRRLLLGALRLH